MAHRRVNIKAILADQDLRRELMIPTIQAVQAREGIETTRDQAERAYYVVNEADKSAFFDLERFRGGKRSEPERREEMFARSLSEGANGVNGVRFDVARRDFSTIDLSPLAYQRIAIVAHLFRELPPAETMSSAHQGVIARPDAPYIRCFWEVTPNMDRRPWKRLFKGGGFSRFYYDSELVLDWSQWAQNSFHRLRDPAIYFKEGLTWPRRTQKGFNLRKLPEGCVFSDKGPSIFFEQPELHDFFLGVANSAFAEYLMHALMSFGSWELTVLRRFPVALGSTERRERIASISVAIYDAKGGWDNGNETSTSFVVPWIMRDEFSGLPIPDRLDRMAKLEATEEDCIQQLYIDLNDEVYRLYGISETSRAIVEDTLGERPPEILWPQMEGKITEQKRMEHVWRLLSYAVKRVVDADEDGIVPFMTVGGETALADRVNAELAALFPDQDINRVEVGINNELRRKVKGYRSVQSIGEWLEDVFFDYHVSLYKKRPILWHIASSQGRGACAFGAMCHYHKFDSDRLAKLRGSYLHDAISLFRREAGLADQEGRTEDRQEWQAKLEEAQALDQHLQWVQEGQNGHPAPGDCRIRTPWKSENELPSGWQPDIDDGVAVNILPLQTAGVLRIAKVV